MQATEELPPLHRARVSTRFARLLVAVNGAVPLAMLAWDAYTHQLGVNAVNFALRTTGLLGLLFLLLSLTITPLRRLTGWNTLIALRRTLGLYAFLHLVVHFSIFFVLDRAGSVGSTIHEVFARTYLQLGTIALTLLIPLAVTSTDGMVLRLGARRWKALHRLVYVATALGALHYYLLVKADVRQPLAFAAVLAALLGFRVVRWRLDVRARKAREADATPAIRAAAPPRRFWSGEMRVTKIIDETPDVRTFRLATVDGAPLPFDYRPGQYLNVSLTIDGKRVNRSYSIASSPTQTAHCEMTVKRAADGYASRYIHESVAEGTHLKIAAPAGRFVLTGAESNGVLLIAGGVGITPLMSMIRFLGDRGWPGSIYLVFAARKRHDVIYSAELEALSRRLPGLRVVVTLTDEPDASWTGLRGRITRELLATVPDVARLPVYLCGPESMMASMRTALLALGVPDAQIKTEAFVSAPTAVANVAPAVATLESGSVDGTPREAGSASVTGVPMARFQRSDKSAQMPPEKTILEAAEDAGIALPFECRSGICGQCKTRLLAGRVTMEVEDALSRAEKAKGLVLACQARAQGDVVVDA